MGTVYRRVTWSTLNNVWNYKYWILKINVYNILKWYWIWVIYTIDNIIYLNFVAFILNEQVNSIKIIKRT